MPIPTFNPGDVLTAEVMNEIKNSLLPVASVIPYAGTTSPEGYLLCDGSAVSRTTYANLFNTISTNYGVGDGSTTFNLPDLRGRAPVGSGTDGATENTYNPTLGAKFGDYRPQSHTHTGTTGFMNSNNVHSPFCNSPGGHSWGANFGGLSGGATFTFSPSGVFAGVYGGSNLRTDAFDINHTHSFTTNPTGSGGSQNQPPSLAVNYIIKI